MRTLNLVFLTFYILFTFGDLGAAEISVAAIAGT